MEQLKLGTWKKKKKKKTAARNSVLFAEDVLLTEVKHDDLHGPI